MDDRTRAAIGGIYGSMARMARLLVILKELRHMRAQADAAEQLLRARRLTPQQMRRDKIELLQARLAA